MFSYVLVFKEKCIMTEWRDRIVAYYKIPVDQLLANPFNARRHPAAQREALRASLDELGIIAPLIVNHRTGYIIDGHARAEEILSKNPDAKVSVIEVDLTEEEEHLALASFDFITTMADYDRGTLDTLLQMVNTDNAAMQDLLAGMSEEVGIVPPMFEPINALDYSRMDEINAKVVTCPCCNCSFDLNGNGDE